MNILRGIVIAVAVLAFTSGTASANSNHPDYWISQPGEVCVKYEPVPTPFYAPAPPEGYQYSKGIVKAGADDIGYGKGNDAPFTVWEGMPIAHSTGKDNSHVILCAVPVVVAPSPTPPVIVEPSPTPPIIVEPSPTPTQPPVVIVPSPTPTQAVPEVTPSPTAVPSETPSPTAVSSVPPVQTPTFPPTEAPVPTVPDAEPTVPVAPETPTEAVAGPTVPVSISTPVAVATPGVGQPVAPGETEPPVVMVTEPVAGEPVVTAMPNTGSGSAVAPVVIVLLVIGSLALAMTAASIVEDEQ